MKTNQKSFSITGRVSIKTIVKHFGTEKASLLKARFFPCVIHVEYLHGCISIEILHFGKEHALMSIYNPITFIFSPFYFAEKILQ